MPVRPAGRHVGPEALHDDVQRKHHLLPASRGNLGMK